MKRTISFATSVSSLSTCRTRDVERKCMKFGTGELLISGGILKVLLKPFNSSILSEIHALMCAFGMSPTKYLPKQNHICNTNGRGTENIF